MFYLNRIFTFQRALSKNLSLLTNKFISVRKLHKMENSNCLVSVCQHTSKSDKNENFNVFKDLIEKSSKSGCKLVFLPECFDMICENKKQIFENAEFIHGELITKYKELASNLKVWLFLGGMHEKTESNNEKTFNSHIVINDKGEIENIYRKLHLFNLDIPGTRLVESDFSVGGNCVESPVNTPAGKVGLGICYDLRFPEFAISMAKAGADILTYPSSFTVKTGISHWEPLLKARAIENQCYVVAAAQTGIHNSKRSSFGHSMIVDPWGQIIAQVGDKTGFAIAEIDLGYLKNVRSRLPVWSDRKPECYGEILKAENYDLDEIDKCKEYSFGQVKIKSCQVFFKTDHSFAFVNHRPILPGHVLIASLREIKKFTELTSVEISDLFRTVKKIEKLLESFYNTNSCTICIQDGLDAGQSIDHIHVHLVPRKSTDFNGIKDEIYSVLVESEKIPIRSEYDMSEQAKKFRSLLKSNNFYN